MPTLYDFENALLHIVYRPIAKKAQSAFEDAIKFFPAMLTSLILLHKPEWPDCFLGQNLKIWSVLQP